MIFWFGFCGLKSLSPSCDILKKNYIFKIKLSTFGIQSLADICLSCLSSVKTCPSFSVRSPFSRPHYLLFSPTVVRVPLLVVPVLPIVAAAPIVCVGEVGGTVPVGSTNPTSYAAAKGTRDTTCWGKCWNNGLWPGLGKGRRYSAHRLKKENAWK